MTKTQIVKELAEAANISKKQAVCTLQSFAKMAYREARNGFTLPGIGKLVVVDRKARMERNPKTGESIQMPAMRVLKFRVAVPAMREVLTFPGGGRFRARLGKATEVKHGAASDIEGIKTEAVHLTTKRSRPLRDRAFAEAKGVCCVCDRDFSQLLDGRGERVLQVHHRQQLSALKMPRRTEVGDLAVVCANCHMLIHINPKKPLAIERLRKMLGNEA